MCRLFVSIVLSCVFSSSLYGQAPEVEVESTIDRVTVFLNGAQVFRTAQVDVPIGRSELHITKLDPNLDPESIQFNIDGPVTVLSVSQRRDFLASTLETEEAERLRLQIETKRDSIAIERVAIEVFEQEERMIAANQSIGGADNGVELERLVAAADFFRDRLTSIKSQRLFHQQRITHLEREIQALERQRNLLTAPSMRTFVSHVVVLVESDRAGAYDITLNYATRNARWTPLYDIRVQEVDMPLALLYKAEVEQSTGEDWENRMITLSTANLKRNNTIPGVFTRRVGYSPILSMSPPPRSRRSVSSRAIPGSRVDNPSFVSGQVVEAETGQVMPGVTIFVPGSNGTGTTTDINGNYVLELPENTRLIRTAYIGYQQVDATVSSNRIDFLLSADPFAQIDELGVSALAEPEVMMDNVMIEEIQQTKQLSRQPTVQTASNLTTTEFEIEDPYTVPSEGTPTLVDIARFDLPVTYEYYAAPAAEEQAYLTARLTDWASLNIQSGRSNLFFKNTFIGQTYLQLQSVEDTLDISLGIDQGIGVERKRQEEFTRNQVLSGRRVDTYAYDIEVRNNKTVPITILIKDTVPVSTDNSIEVRLEESDGASVEENTGILQWRRTLEAGASETISFRYSLRYPRDRQVYHY